MSLTVYTHSYPVFHDFLCGCRTEIELSHTNFVSHVINTSSYLQILVKLSEIHHDSSNLKISLSNPIDDDGRAVKIKTEVKITRRDFSCGNAFHKSLEMFVVVDGKYEAYLPVELDMWSDIFDGNKTFEIVPFTRQSINNEKVNKFVFDFSKKINYLIISDKNIRFFFFVRSHCVYFNLSGRIRQSNFG